MPQPSTQFRWVHILTWLLWLVLALGVSSYSYQQDFKRTVVPAYRQASLQWWQGQSLYGELDSIHGFLYLPAAAVVTSPFALLPSNMHEILWRCVSVLVLAYAVHQLALVLQSLTNRPAFIGMSLLVIPVAVGSTTAGQMNLLLAASMTLACVALMHERWNQSALWLALGLALKPQMIVPLLLVTALFAPMRWRGVLAIMGVLLLPFIFQHPTYVLEQYALCIEKLRVSADPLGAGSRNNDLVGLLATLGVNLSMSAQSWLRLIAALLTLLACWWAVRRRDKLHGPLMTLALAGCYLMLFNPRTEGGSYVILAIPLAALALWHIDAQKRWLPALPLIFIALGWAFSYDLSQTLAKLARRIVGPENIGEWRYWLSPLLALFFTGIVLSHIRSGRCKAADGIGGR